MAIVVLFLSVIVGAFAQNNTVIDVLRANRETQLLDLIQAAGLTDTLKGQGPFTIFAPTNLALAGLGSSTLSSLKANPTALGSVLQYHVVAGNLMSTDLMVNEKMLDSLSGAKIRVNYYLYKKRIAVEGVRVTKADLKASNGVVHLVDGVLTPPNGTFVDILSTNPNLSTLKAAVETAGLAEALNDGPYTLFAPSNQAFARLGDDLIQKLLASPDVLKSILLYHVLHGTLYSTGMHSGSLHNLEEVDRERLYASFSGRTIHIDNANVIQKDISATNGVIHVIDHVMVPTSLRAAVNAL